MKKVFFKIASFLLALLVWFSTVSFTVQRHFCGDFLIDASLIVGADSCGMDMATEQSRSMDAEQSRSMATEQSRSMATEQSRSMATDGSGSACIIAQNSCCSEETTLIEGQDTLQKTVDTELHQQVIFLKVFVYTYINLFDGLEENIVPFRDYSPPLVVRDIQVLNDTFLI